MFCCSAKLLRDRVQRMKCMYRKLAGGDVVQSGEYAGNVSRTSSTGFNKVSDVLTQIRRVRLLLKESRSTVAQTPGNRLIKPSVDEPRRNPISPRGFRAESLDGGHSHRLRTLRSLADLELDSLVLLKGAKTVPLDLRMVDEHIFCAAIRGDEAESLLAVEPFNGSLCHTKLLSFQVSVI